MPRSIRVRREYISEVKAALPRHGFVRQIDLAERVQLAQGTVSSFLNGKSVDYLNFIELCHVLELDWQTIADLDPRSADSLSPLESQYQEPAALLNSKSQALEDLYVEHQSLEQHCYREITNPGCLIRIKAPQKMGKTSLIARVLWQAAQQGSQTVYLNLQLADQASLETLDQFLQWFCANIALQLHIPDKLDEYWSKRLGSKVSFKTYFEQYLLPEINCLLTLGIDEIDRLFEYPAIYQDFFGLLRVLHEEGKRNSIWQRFRLVIAHATEMYIPMDVNQSPFNVGWSIELPELSLEQMQDLVQRHQLNWNSGEVEQLMQITGGHPFLVRLALYHIACGDITLAEVLQTASTETGIYGDQLRRLGNVLLRQPELEAAMREVVTTPGPVRLTVDVKFKLLSLGLVKQQEDGAIPRYELYRQYFSKLLSESDSE